jgi:multiple RNA-binding domain-containing protein 1
VTKEELQDKFGKYGEIIDIEIPFRKRGRGVPLGIGFIRFETSEAAISAYAELDKSYFQGRKLHIKPAEKKPPAVEDPFRENQGNPENQATDNNHDAGFKSEYKQQKE